MITTTTTMITYWFSWFKKPFESPSLWSEFPLNLEARIDRAKAACCWKLFHTRESYLFKRNVSALLQWVDIDWWPLVNVVGMKLSMRCTVLRNNSKYATEYWFIVLQHFTVMNRQKNRLLIKLQDAQNETICKHYRAEENKATYCDDKYSC